MNEETGSLEVQVYFGSLINPVENVDIEIKEDNRTLYRLVTNAFGRTTIIHLPAPSVANSLEDIGEPYYEYDLVATKDGYSKVVINNIQIYPETHAVQNVSLRPVDAATMEIINIKEPTLYGDYPEKIPEDDVKPLNPADGFVVLDEVIIPEFIIVHDGAPDQNATNYRVPFKDYIKNVACSEIYSTWPLETIKANIYAIISFTLNRVYTEWYRNKGYNFTITSTTSRDQAYNHDRTLYDEITVVVDDIFTRYVTKPNIRQPLLTQYCDGKKSSCPKWLQQWGSKDLGLQGKSANEILKYYYGQEVYLEEANKVAGVPESFKGITLSLGSKGQSVKIIQEQINAISNNFPLIPKIKVDSVYGEDTKKSIEVFQEVFKLPVTGTVNKETWYKLSEIFVAVSKIAAL